MSILLAFAGVVIAVLFASAGYRATNVVRFRGMRDKIVHNGLIQSFYDSVRKSNLSLATSFLRRAVVARSLPARSHC